jgi:hypothetical protein
MADLGFTLIHHIQRLEHELGYKCFNSQAYEDFDTT